VIAFHVLSSVSSFRGRDTRRALLPEMPKIRIGTKTKPLFLGEFIF